MAGSDVAERLHDVLGRLFGIQAPVRLHAWNGSEAGPVDAPVVHVKSRRALRRMLWRPDELGLARAYVAGEVEIEGDLLEGLEYAAPFGRRIGRDLEMTAADRRELLRTAVLLGAVGPAPKPPPEEVAGAHRRPEVARDRAAARGYHDVGNAFYSYLLGSSLVYSCAYWDQSAGDLHRAQVTKLDAVCRRLGLAEGMRLLDVGCGWGSLLLHAAERYGVAGVGITVSEEQAELASKRLREAGVDDRVEVRVAHWREVEDGPYDAIASIGIADYLGSQVYDEYAATLARLLRPGGRLLNLQTTRRTGATTPERSFMDAYVFPGGLLMPLGRVVAAVEDAGLEVRRTESVREHYALTLRAWLANLEANWAACVAETSPGRVRVWRLYLSASVLAFEAARVNAHEVLAVRAFADGRSGLPSRLDVTRGGAA